MKMGVRNLENSKKLQLMIFAALTIFIILPLFIQSRYIIHVFVLIFMFAGMAVAWNIIGGYGAQISWCHAAFFAVGGYTSIILFLKTGISPIFSIFVGMAFSTLIAILIGYPSFKLRGTFFSLATIAFGEILKLLLLYFKDFTGGANGLMLPFAGAKAINLQFHSEVPYYYIMLGLAVLIIYLTYRLEKSRIGYYLKAISEDEDAAQSLGIEANKVKLIAFIISGVMVSALGTISAFNISYIDPNSVANLDLSIKIGVIAIIGGIGKLWGPVLGAFLVVPLTEITNTLFGSTRGGVSTAIYGFVLIMFVLFQPNGVIAFFNFKKDKKVSNRGKDVRASV